MYQSKTQIKNYQLICEGLMSASVISNSNKMDSIFSDVCFLTATPDFLADLILQRDEMINVDMSY